MNVRVFGAVTYNRILTASFCADNIDYTYSPTTYVFGPTDDNEPVPSLVIPIPINDDHNDESNENFKLTLEVSAEDRAASVIEGPISTTVVLIKSDDCKLYKTTLCKHSVTLVQIIIQYMSFHAWFMLFTTQFFKFGHHAVYY